MSNADSARVSSTKKKEKVSIYAYLFIKRLFDIICALIGIVVLLPLSIIIKISYMITGDFQSIFYKHIRIGKDGKEFYLYKFRSMVKNADEELKKLMDIPKYRKEWDQNHKLSDDPRVTKIGLLLRKTSLDETPQFINVLLGNMSIVGPRPLVPGELKKHHGDSKIYESVKPGITSNWTVNGRSDVSYKKRLELEYEYIKNRSLLFDLKVIIKTFLVVIKKSGAK